jgi:hypothetical protein
MHTLISKAETLLEALPYIQKFSGATFVVKYGGSFMDSPDAAVREGVARDVVFLEAVEINPVVVHGGGKAITRAMEKAGLKPTFIGGQRVTDERTVEVVDQVLSREINPEIVATIRSLGGAAQRLCRDGHFHLPQAGPRRRRHRWSRSRFCGRSHRRQHRPSARKHRPGYHTRDQPHGSG